MSDSLVQRATASVNPLNGQMAVLASRIYTDLRISVNPGYTDIGVPKAVDGQPTVVAFQDQYAVVEIEGHFFTLFDYEGAVAASGPDLTPRHTLKVGRSPEEAVEENFSFATLEELGVIFKSWGL